MSNKLGHAVHTRRRCGWDIQGKPNYTDGHGIYSASRDLFEDACDRDLRDVVMNHQHRQDAYAYFVPGEGRPMLSVYRKRTEDEKRAAEEAGVDNRASYIAEWLVGDFDRYAFEYMGSPFWQTIYQPIADFYANEEPVPLEEPLDESAVPTAAVSRQDIMAFVADGRTGAVKAAVWALMRQFDLPAAERKFLVIRDTEDNVRKWVAAIGYSFPVKVANCISFNTCMEKLNQEPDCCYYVQRTTGLYTKSRNIQDPNQERRWYYMIAGADPADRTSDRTANPMPNAPYLVIDGATKQARFETDQLMLRSFMKDVAVNDAGIADFCNYMNEMQGIGMGTHLCDLYDAQITLTNEAAWTCAGLSKALARLMPHFTKRSVLMRYIISRLCIDGEYEAHFALEDEQNGLGLLRMLYRLMTGFDVAEAAQAMQKMLVSRMGRLLEDSRATDKLNAYISCLKEIDAKQYAAVIVEIVETTRLGMITDSSIASGSDAYILMLFDVLDIYLNSRGIGWADFFRGNEFSHLVNALIARSLKDEQMPGKILKLLSGDNKAIDSYIVRGCRCSNSDSQMLRWWRTMLQNRVSAEYLCGLISSNQIGMQEIEHVLCQEIQMHGCNDSVKRLFNQYLATVPGAGSEFYRTWIRSVSGSRDRVATLRRILSEMAANTNYATLTNETLIGLDGEIRLETGKEVSELAELVYDFAFRTRTQCNNALLWKYLTTMVTTKIPRRDRDGIAGVFLQANAGGYRYAATDDLLRSELGADFMARLQEYDEQPAAHIIALNSFTFRNAGAWRAYVQQYARAIVGSTVKKKSYALASVLELLEKVDAGQPTQDPGAEKLRGIFAPMELSKQLNELLSAIQAELSSCRTDHMSEKMISAVDKEFGPSVATRLEQMFNAAQEAYKRNNQGQNILSKLFGRLKK